MCSGSVSHPSHVQLRFTIVPLLKQMVHLVLLWNPMKPVIFILPLFLGTSDIWWVGEMDSVLSHVFKKLHHTFLCKIASMQDTGFIKELLFHIKIVTPITGLKEGSMILKAGLEEAPQCSQYYEEEKDGPANCLNRVRKVKSQQMLLVQGCSFSYNPVCQWHQLFFFSSHSEQVWELFFCHCCCSHMFASNTTFPLILFEITVWL